MRGALKVGAIAFVVVLLLGLLITMIGRWRETANRTRCQYHLSRVGLHAMWSYTDPASVFPTDEAERVSIIRVPDQAKLDADRLFPPGTVANSELAPERRLSWCVVLLQYLNTGDLAKRFDMDKGWEYESNHEAAKTLVPYLVCPSQFQKHDSSVPAPSHYLGMAGYGPDAPTLKQTDRRAGMFRYDDPTRIGAVQRGLSYTVSFLETSHEIGPWAAGGPSTVRGFDPNRALIGRGAQFGGAHPKGANIAFADGSVRFHTSEMSARLFRMQVTLAPFDEP